jgi:hypothetical protein
MRRALLLGGGLAALAAGWAIAASPVINETVAIVDATTPTQQAGVDASGNLKVNCTTGCSASSGVGANNADSVAPVSTGLGQAQSFLFGFDGTNWDRLRLDGSDYLKVNCATGCAAGTAGNNADAVATVTTGLGQNQAYLYGFNGTSWDRLEDDASKNLKVNVNAALPTGANTIGAVTQSGTWNIGSITTLPALPTGANTIGAVTQSGTWNIGSITTLPALPTGSNTIGAVTQSGTWNIGSITTLPALPTGSNTIGVVGLNAGTNTIGQVGLVPVTSGGLSISSTQVASNTTAIVVKGSAGQLYGLELYNNSATIAYVKLYNATSATCGSGTVIQRAMIPANASGAGAISNNVDGLAYSTGITMCITGGFADSDTTAPSASTYIVNVLYK